MVRRGEIELGERLADLAADLGGRVFHVFRAALASVLDGATHGHRPAPHDREGDQRSERRATEGNTDCSQNDEEPRLLPPLLDIGVIMQGSRAARHRQAR